MKPTLAAYLLCAVTCVSACSSDDGAPRFASGGGPGGAVDEEDASVASGDDAGADDEDSGTTQLTGECEAVNPTAAADEDIPLEDRQSTIGFPSDFLVTRISATWIGKCADPTLVIELSDGKCPVGKGHELSFFISAKAVREGLVRAGDILLLPEPNDIGVSVRYARPDGLDPKGTWGTCAAASGTLTLPEGLDIDTRGTLRGSFMLTLTDCSDGDSELAPQIVDGRFNVRLQRAVNDRCPNF